MKLSTAGAAISVAILTGCTSSPSLQNSYVGAGLSGIASGKSVNMFNVKKGQDRTGNLMLTAGYNVNPNLDIEARVGTSITDGDLINHTVVGVYAKPKYEIYKNLNLYGLLGVGYLKASQHNNSGVKFSDTNLHLGLGASYQVSQNVELYTDYISYSRSKKLKKALGTSSKVDTSALSAGFNYHF